MAFPNGKLFGTPGFMDFATRAANASLASAIEIIDGYWFDTRENRDHNLHHLNCYKDALTYYSNVVQSFDGQFQNPNFQLFIAGMFIALLEEGFNHATLVKLRGHEHARVLDTIARAKDGLSDTEEDEPDWEPHPEPDDSLDDDEERGFWDELPRDGESDSDMLGWSSSANSNAPERPNALRIKRAIGFRKHQDYIAKGRELTHWLDEEQAQGKEHPVGDIHSNWLLYSSVNIEAQQHAGNQTGKANLHRGHFTIDDGRPSRRRPHLRGSDLCIPSPSKLQSLGFKITMPDVPNVASSKIYTITATKMCRSTATSLMPGGAIRYKFGIRFLGNGYLSLHIPAYVIGCKGDKLILFTGVSLQKEKHTRDMEWTKVDGRWVYQGPYEEKNTSYEEGDSDSGEGFCYYEDKEMQCSDENCPKHSRMDEREW